MKHLQSPRLNYTLFTPKQAVFYKKLVKDAQVMRFISGAPLTEEAASARFEKALALAKQLSGSGYFLVTSKSKNVGFCKVQLFGEKKLEIGYVVSTQFQGMGFASEMVQAMLNYIGSSFVGFEVLALVDMDNKASIHVLEKSGFLYKESKKHNGFISGFYVLPQPS